MRYGFVRVAAASPEVSVADPGRNALAIKDVMKKAREEGTDVLVLPELALTGYTCADLFFQRALTLAAKEALFELIEYSAGCDMLTAVGLPLEREGKLYNCAAVFSAGRLLGVAPKVNLPNYGEFGEVRQFSPSMPENVEIELMGQTYPFGPKLLFDCQSLPSLCVAVEICEDMWVPASPSINHCAAGATLVLNLSASDEAVGKAEFRRSLASGLSARMACAYAYADSGPGESTTDLVFGAHNLICEDGTILAESEPFGAGYAQSDVDMERITHERKRLNTYAQPKDEGYRHIGFELDKKGKALIRNIERSPFIPADKAELEGRCEEILNIQAYGLKKRLLHTKSKTAVIGVSGGLDSCLALLVAARACDLMGFKRESIVAVTMPCFGTTERTRGNAHRLSELLGARLMSIDIKQAVSRHFEDIGLGCGDFGAAYENAQARERTQILMDIANMTGGLVVGTGDLSELALGWATYNGDHMSMYGVNASVPKTLIRHIVGYAAHKAGDPELASTLYDILNTPISPELLPSDGAEISQKTEDLLGPYELHDFFLYHVLRWGERPKKVYYLACVAFKGVYEGEQIIKWLKLFYRRFFAQQFKRSCLPDGPRVGSVGLSPRGDWRMPSDASPAAWLKELDEISGG